MSQLMDYYKAIEDSSAGMLDAARREDWDAVLRYESACAVLIGQLRFQAQLQPLRPEQRRPDPLPGRALAGPVRAVAGRPVADAALKATGGWRPDSGARRATNHIVRPACS